MPVIQVNGASYNYEERGVGEEVIITVPEGGHYSVVETPGGSGSHYQVLGSVVTRRRALSLS